MLHIQEKCATVLFMKEKVSATQKALNVWAIVLILWSIYRANFKTDFPIWFDEFIMKPLFFILPVYEYIRAIELKPFFERVGLHTKNLVGDIVIGFAVGIGFLLSGYIASTLRASSAHINIFALILSTQTLYLLLVAFATAFSEEILSRGFILKRLYEESRSAFQAILISSILFFFLHIPMLFTSEKITGMLLLRIMTTDLLLSVVVSILFLQRKSLVLPIIVHALYNLSLILFI